jgi:hypothetical protein
VDAKSGAISFGCPTALSFLAYGEIAFAVFFLIDCVQIILRACAGFGLAYLRLIAALDLGADGLCAARTVAENRYISDHLRESRSTRAQPMISRCCEH